MSLPRFRLRTLMIAVAVAAIMMALATRERWRRCWELRQHHAEGERALRLRLPALESRADEIHRAGITDRELELRLANARFLIGYHSKMKKLYEGACWRLWERPPADPPVQ